jgi:hypothetical protein
MADTATGMLPPLGDDGSDKQSYIVYTPDGHPMLMHWIRNAPLELRLDRYGCGRGIYLDPAEQRAAQYTAELLHRLRTEAGQAVAAYRRARHG